MSMAKEFKEFAMRGSVVDLAVGVIIGGAFGKIVSSLVNDVLMPPIGMLMGGVDFGSLVFTLKETAAGSAAVTLRYGLFINAVIDFVIVAFCIFLLIKSMNSFRKKQEAPATTTRDCPECLMTVPLKAKRCGHCGCAIVS
jgi:large conductance mechanosensitive channel